MIFLVILLVGALPWAIMLVLGATTHDPVWLRRSEGALILGFVLWLAGNLLAGNLLGAAIDAGVATFVLYERFKDGRGKRLVRQLGEKSRAKLAQLMAAWQPA